MTILTSTSEDAGNTALSGAEVIEPVRKAPWNPGSLSASSRTHFRAKFRASRTSMT
jgi:hypothetical protein